MGNYRLTIEPFEEYENFFNEENESLIEDVEVLDKETDDDVYDEDDMFQTWWEDPGYLGEDDTSDL